jgi:serine/threonine-protein kinase
VHVIGEVASALTAAHGKGFIHRDLKPDNVFLVAHPGRTECKLLDFGLAKLMPTATISRAYRTATGAQLGTPDYMSPEQLKGAGGVDARTDLYALGVLAFEILVGERPRRYSDGTFELGGKTVAEAILDKARPPKELAQLVEAMLSYEADNRPSLAAVQTVLKRVKSAVPSTSVIGLEVSLPQVRAIGTEPALGASPPYAAAPATPQTGVPTVVDGARSRGTSQPPASQRPASEPGQRPSQPSIPPSNSAAAGLRASSSPLPGTKLGVAPAPARPSRPHPVASQQLAEQRESRTWLVVAALVLLVAGAALVFVLVR